MWSSCWNIILTSTAKMRQRRYVISTRIKNQKHSKSKVSKSQYHIRVFSLNHVSIHQVKIIWDGYMSVELHTPHTETTCGLCGNSDGLEVPAFYMRWGGTTGKIVG